MYAFMAIVAHYVNKDGQLGLLFFNLSYFWELLGEHSGENMAEAVWETLVMYRIEGRVVITCDLSKPICLPM